MSRTLTPIGYTWAFISVLAAFFSCTGFYLPYWIQGKLLGERETSFGSFVRCGYPKVTESGGMEIVPDCGRYASFWSIPSGWWRWSTILGGTGATLSLLIGLTALASCCVTDVLNSTSAKCVGVLQLLSALLISSGVLIYPLGWDNQEVLDACSEQSAPYQLGSCKLHWSIYLMASGIVFLFISFSLSFKACRVKKGTYRI